MLDSAFRSHGD